MDLRPVGFEPKTFKKKVESNITGPTQAATSLGLNASLVLVLATLELMPFLTRVHRAHTPISHAAQRNVPVLLRPRAPTRVAQILPAFYEIRYGDSSFSVGFYGTETLTLTPDSVFPNFKFGCGENNQGFRGSDGLLGLGRYQISAFS